MDRVAELLNEHANIVAVLAGPNRSYTDPLGAALLLDDGERVLLHVEFAASRSARWNSWNSHQPNATGSPPGR